MDASPKRVVVEVSGGVVQQIYADNGVVCRVLDWDNLKGGEPFEFDPNDPIKDMYPPVATMDEFLQSKTLTEALKTSKKNIDSTH